MVLKWAHNDKAITSRMSRSVLPCIQSGNAGEKKVFNGKRDKTKFLEYIGKVAERFSVVTRRKLHVKDRDDKRT